MDALDPHLEHYAEKVAERVVELLRESPPIPLDILTPAQAARYLGYTIRSLESLRLRGLGPKYIKIADGRGKCRYRLDDLRAYVASQNAKSG